jgi:hypothetical protein
MIRRRMLGALVFSSTTVVLAPIAHSGGSVTYRCGTKDHHPAHEVDNEEQVREYSRKYHCDHWTVHSNGGSLNASDAKKLEDRANAIANEEHPPQAIYR